MAPAFATPAETEIPLPEAAPENSADWLTVSRTPSAHSCPDAATMNAQVSEMLDEPVPLRKVSVKFQHSHGTYSATIRPAESSGVRVLSDTHSDCKPLGEATATAIALLLEQDESENVAAPVAPPLPEPVEDKPETLSRPSSTRVGFGVKGGASLGTTGETAGFVDGSVHLGRGLFQFETGVFHVLPSEQASGPGTVTQKIWAVTARVCASPLSGQSIALGLCSGFYWGLLRATAEGFDENSTLSRPWFAVPLQASLGVRVLRQTRTEAWIHTGATALATFKTEAFVVEGLGEVTQTSLIPVLLWAGISVNFTPF